MVLLQMFFSFEVEVFEVLEGFEAWFLQSFCTFECFWIFSDAACALDSLVCWNALGRLLLLEFGGRWATRGEVWLVTHHNLIGPLMSLLTHDGLHMSSLTCAGLPMSSLTCADVWLVFLHAFYASISMTGKFLLVSE